MMKTRLLVVLAWCLWRTFCAGVPVSVLENREVKSSKVLDFLQRFGYVEEDDGHSSALYTEEGISGIIKTVQEYGAIPQTGVLDNDTIKLMASPRCGVPDIIRSKTGRSKRYVLAPSGWNKRRITYFIANWSPKLGEHVVMKNIQLALDTWGRYARLSFQRSSTLDADIIVAFGRGYHGDSFPFDGKGYILAHAFFPGERRDLAGDIHFDEDEDWIDRKREGSEEEGVDFLTVALHELGHSLGLAHSVNPSAVMFPYYRGHDPTGQLQLGYDDIVGMYELYIRRNIPGDEYIPYSPEEGDEEDQETSTASSTPPTTPTQHFTTETPRGTTREADFTTTTTASTRQRTSRYSTTPTDAHVTPTVSYHGDDETVDDHRRHDERHGVPPTNSPSLPDICQGRFDAVATLREELFFFKEQYVWRLKERGRIERGYPVTIYQMFPDLPKTIKHVDAAYERPDGMIVIFTGNQFWVYDGQRFVEGSPRPLSHYGLPSTLDKIDAVQIWGRNGKTYIYKHDRFWRYNETTKEMDPGYPKHMERWRGVPEDLDAVTTWKDGVTYFFKDELFWKFDNNWVIVDESSPLPSPQIWIGCPEDERNMRRLP